MSGTCCSSEICDVTASKGFRKALWVALVVNASMFLIEVIGGERAGSVSLWADALDFAGDSANYAISLAVLAMGLGWRARAALLKGVSMMIFGGFVLAKSGWSIYQGIPPETMVMTIIGFMALTANVVVALILYAYRSGDANMRSVWLCSRNDAIGNIAVIIAAVGVSLTSSELPDVIVAIIMASLAIHSGWAVIKQALAELRSLREPS